MRLGIIGCGLIGQKRAAAAKGHTIVAVADLDAGRAGALAQKTGAKSETDWRAVVGADVDAVVVAVSHDQLGPIATAAVEAGKHVLMEKPGGRMLSDATPVREAAKKHSRIVKVGFNHRFHPAIWKAKEMVDAGALGPLMFVRGRYGHGGRPGYDKEWRAVPEISGGGELIDQGSHLIDLSRWILGDLTLEYAATPTYFWDMPVDDNCFLALKAAGGQMAWLHATWTEWKNLFSLEIYGRDGKLAVDGLGGSYGTEKLTYYKMLPGMGPPETTSWEYPFPDKSWDDEFANFAAAIDGKAKLVGDIDDACAMLALTDKAYGRGRP